MGCSRGASSVAAATMLSSFLDQSVVWNGKGVTLQEGLEYLISRVFRNWGMSELISQLVSLSELSGGDDMGNRGRGEGEEGGNRGFEGSEAPSPTQAGSSDLSSSGEDTESSSGDESERECEAAPERRGINGKQKGQLKGKDRTGSRLLKQERARGLQSKSNIGK